MIKRLLFHPGLRSVGIPFVSATVLACLWGQSLNSLYLVVVSLSLIFSVFISVHHAEVIAHRVGEPFGSLILAVAVTIIEVALIVSMMLSGGESAAVIARDTVFSAIMIVCNGVVGMCLMVGGIRHRELGFNVDGTVPSLSVIAALSVLTLVLPTYTTTAPGPFYSEPQLIFSGVMSFIMYGVFVFVQTVRHRDYFLPAQADGDIHHSSQPSNRDAFISLGLLMLCLVVVIGLAKMLSPAIKHAVEAASAPQAVVGIVIALLVLLPETWAAIRAALQNRMQISLNLALGSVLATIGLTIPTVAAVSVLFHMPLELGLSSKEMVQLSLTLLVSTTSLASGRATVLQGAVHLLMFSAFLFLAIVP